MADRLVRYTPLPWTHEFYEAGEVKVPLDALLEGIGASIDETPGFERTYGPFREWLRSQAGAVVDIPPEHYDTAFWLIIDLLEKGVGTVYCHACQEEVRPERKAWGWQAGPDMGEGGTDIFCGQGHTLIHVQAWVS